MGSRIELIVLLCILLVVGIRAGLYILAVAAAVGPSSACRSRSNARPKAGTTVARTLVSGEHERCYLLHMPRRHDPGRTLPLVVVLHGLASIAEMIQDVTGWSEFADREGLSIAYPDGLLYPLRWSANR